MNGRKNLKKLAALYIALWIFRHSGAKPISTDTGYYVSNDSDYCLFCVIISQQCSNKKDAPGDDENAFRNIEALSFALQEWWALLFSDTQS